MESSTSRSAIALATTRPVRQSSVLFTKSFLHNYPFGYLEGSVGEDTNELFIWTNVILITATWMPDYRTILRRFSRWYKKVGLFLDRSELLFMYMKGFVYRVLDFWGYLFLNGWEEVGLISWIPTNIGLGHKLYDHATMAWWKCPIYLQITCLEVLLATSDTIIWLPKKKTSERRGGLEHDTSLCNTTV